MKMKLAVVSTHPIQYLVPIYKELASSSSVDLFVIYGSDYSVRGSQDPGFGCRVAWDIPLLQGYEYSITGDFSPTQRFSGIFSRRIQAELSSRKYDAVLIGAYTPMWMLRAIVCASDLNLPILFRGETTDVALERSWLKSSTRHEVLKRLYKSISFFLPIGVNSQRHYIAHGVPPEKMELSPYCVDNRFFQSAYNQCYPFRSRVRKELGFGQDTFVVIFSGKLVGKKDPMTLLKAMAQVSANVGLIVMGDGQLRAELEDWCRKNLRHQFVFVGFQNQTALGRYYVAADALVLPSAWGETWGLVVNEAMNFGLPAVVSDKVGCAPDLVLHGKTGFVFPTGDDDSLRRHIGWLATERQSLRHMGELARARVSKYGVDQAVAGVVRALRRATSFS